MLPLGNFFNNNKLIISTAIYKYNTCTLNDNHIRSYIRIDHCLRCLRCTMLLYMVHFREVTKKIIIYINFFYKINLPKKIKKS